MPADKTTGIILGFAAASMLALAYASVPLYRIFCQKTGFGGTPQVAKLIPSKTINKIIKIQFTATTHRDLPWEFIPLQREVYIKVGQTAITHYRAINKSNIPFVGMATYNVSPDKAGIYFNKVQCFCFEQQKLNPGQAMDMPVFFFLDPDFATDPDTKDLTTITLSYTFFRYKP